MKTLEERVNRAKKEIEEDIKNGILPDDINSFYDLDSYVDGNAYAGFCDEDYIPTDTLEFENKVQTAIDEWLNEGL